MISGHSREYVLERDAPENHIRKLSPDYDRRTEITFLNDPTDSFQVGAQFSVRDFMLGFIPDKELGTITWPEGLKFTRRTKNYYVRGGKIVNEMGGLVDIANWHTGFKL